MLLAAVLVLAGCSSGDDAEAGPESSESPSATESPTESPSEPPPPEPIDPCSLLTADDLATAGVATADTEKAVRGLAPDPRTTACLVPDRKDGWAAYYGYSLVPNVSVAEAMEQVGTEKPVKLDVGDQARMVLYRAYGDKVWHGWASEGRYAVMVQLFAKPRPARVEQLLARLLEQVDPVMFDFPVDLPDECPAAASRPIQKVLGPVFTGTGSDTAGDLRCSYANRGGRSVNLQLSSYKNAQKVATTVRDVEQYYDERSTPARGVTLFVSPGDAYAFSGGYVTRPPTFRGTDLQQATVIGSYYRELTYDAQAYRALAAWWATRS